MAIGKLFNSIVKSVTSSSKLQSKLASDSIKIIDESPEMLTKASECLGNIGKAQIHIIPEDLTPSVQTLEKMTSGYGMNDAKTTQTTQDIVAYLKKISSSLEATISSGTNEDVEEALAKNQ